VTHISEILDGMFGQRIPGGCPDCDAYQEMTKQHGIYVMTIHHDDTCPAWRQIQARREARR
jgi:hypothetical protein